MQYHAIPCNTMQYHAIPCNTMQCHAIPCNTMQYHAIPCNTMQYYALQCNSMQYHAIPCNTMQYNAIPCIINNCWRSVPLPCGQYMAILLAPSGALIAIPTYYWPTTPPHFFRSHRSSTLDFHFLSHYSYIKAIMLYKGNHWTYLLATLYTLWVQQDITAR